MDSKQIHSINTEEEEDLEMNDSNDSENDNESDSNESDFEEQDLSQINRLQDEVNLLSICLICLLNKLL
jgi:hypothetical protein